MTAMQIQDRSMTTIESSVVLKLATEAALAASETIIKYREASHNNREALGTSFKSSVRDLVTKADVEAERIIIETISGHPISQSNRPLFLGEESSQDLSVIREASNNPEKILWVIDPIDGTTNFAHGHPHCAVSIGVAYAGHVQIGVVYNPFTKELFSARRGEGAYLNGKQIKCQEISKLDQALVATGLPSGRSPDKVALLMAELNTIASNCLDIRRLGAASLDFCWVACGRLHAYYETVKPWDMAAGALIAREAGAVVGVYKNAPRSFESSLEEELYSVNLLTSVPAIYSQMQEILRKS